MKHTALKRMAVGIATLATWGCTAPKIADDTHGLAAGQDLVSVGQALVVEPPRLRSPARNQSTVSVELCWNMTGGAFDAKATERGWVREAIDATWATVANISFSGWDERCGSNPSSSKFAMVLPYWLWINGPDGTTEELQMQVNAVRYFGHELGLMDSTARYDWAGCVDDSPDNLNSGEFGALLGNAAEEFNSAMSTCWGSILENYEQTGTFLSEADIRDVRKLYGGSSQHINYGSQWVFRSQNREYLRLSSQGVVSLSDTFAALDGTPPAGEYPVVHRVFRFYPAGSTPSNKVTAQYGDTVRILSVNQQLFVCAEQVGDQVQLIAVSPTSPEATTKCNWSIQRTPAGVGGNNVDVNDPFRLRREPQFPSGYYYLKLDNETHWRALGPFATQK